MDPCSPSFVLGYLTKLSNSPLNAGGAFDSHITPLVSGVESLQSKGRLWVQSGLGFLISHVGYSLLVLDLLGLTPVFQQECLQEDLL